MRINAPIKILLFITNKLQIMGKWYVVEVLDHKIGPTTGEINTARVIIDSCPIIKLREDRGLLRLLWSEELGDLEYTFGVPDPVGAPGSWISTVPQNGIPR